MPGNKFYPTSNFKLRKEVEEELKMIVTEPYKTEQSERNHQIFAKALLFLVQQTRIQA